MVDNIIFPCRHCGKSLEVEPAGAGMTVKCPVCNHDIEIPKPAEQPDSTATVLDTPPLPSSGSLADKSAKSVSDPAPIEKIAPNISVRRPLLFSATVALALIFSITAIVLLVITGWKFLMLTRWESTRIEYADVARALTKTPSTWDDLARGMSPLLQKYFAAKERRPILISWVDGLDEQGRREFCHNLDQVVTEAQRQSNDVWRVMNEYAKVKQIKLRTQNTIQRRTFRLKELTFVTIGLFMTGIVLAVFTGVAVLLAVERNTRRTLNNYKP